MSLYSAKLIKEDFYPGALAITSIKEHGGWCRMRTCSGLRPSVINVSHSIDESFYVDTLHSYCFMHFFILIKERYIFFSEKLFNELYMIKLLNDEPRKDSEFNETETGNNSSPNI